MLNVNVRLSPDAIARADALADHLGRSRHSVLVDAVERGLNELTAAKLRPGEHALERTPDGGVFLRVRLSGAPDLAARLFEVLQSETPSWLADRGFEVMTIIAPKDSIVTVQDPPEAGHVTH